MQKEKSKLKKFASGIMVGAITVSAIPGIAAMEISAATTPSSTLSVDMTDEQGEIIHGAAGFLYGVSSEDVPTTNTLVPLKPKVLCTKGALGTEHPYGDALDVAKTFLESGGEQVMMYNSNYYGVFGVTADYKDYSEVLENIIAPHVKEWKESWNEEHGTPEAPKDNIGAQVDIDEALIYIPINEGSPNVGAPDFGVAWKSYYDAIHAGDPEATVAGTNDWAYNSAFGTYKDENGEEKSYNLDNFLPYCIENDCMPDIITWHELDAGSLITMGENKKDFVQKWNKAWKGAGKSESEIPELPQICINEYAQGGDCGVPGRLVNWIARLEDNGMYGCLPFWHQANNLNDLTADANEANGAWWAFKWYGDMSGQRLAVKSNTEYNKLYGLATIDDNKQSGKVLFGGQDGGTSVVLKHVTGTKTFKNAEKVHIKIEATSNVGLVGAQTKVPTVMEGTFPVNEDGSVIVSIQNAKFSTAYCLTMTKANEEDSIDNPVVSAYQNYYEAEQGEVEGNAEKFTTWTSAGEYFGPGSYLSDDQAVLMKKDGQLTYTIEVPTDGKYELNFIYGNGTGTKRTDPENSLSLNLCQSMQIDGESPAELTMNNTLLTNTTGGHKEYVDLKAGTHKIVLKSLDEGEILHDLLIVQYYGAYNQEIRGMNSILEAEHADFNTLLNNTVTTVSTRTDIQGYSRDGYVKGLTRKVTEGGGLRWNVVVKESGLYNFTLRYQSEEAGNANIYIGNTATTLDRKVLSLGAEHTVEEWKLVTGTAYLQRGINIVDVDADVDLALDYLRVDALQNSEDTTKHTTVIEAEDCIPDEAAGLIETGESAGASGNVYVKGMDGDQDAKSTPGKYLEIVYNAPEAGEYQLQVYQSNDEICGTHGYNTKVIDKYMSFAVSDEEGNELSDKRYFFMNTNSQDSFKEKSIPVTLVKGINKIRVYNDDSWSVYYGGTQSEPGTDKLDNRTPNIDKFVFTPTKLAVPVEQETRYVLNLRTTAGGYAVSAEDTVSPGDTFHLTIVPETTISRVLVDGVDCTADVEENEDGTFALDIDNVQADVETIIYFSDVNNEYKDPYIKNAGFGTGTTLYWESSDVTVRSDAANSYEGYYAVLNSGSRLSQTVSDVPSGTYFVSVYGKKSEDAQGNVSLEVTTAGKTDRKIMNMDSDYMGTAAKIQVKEGEAVAISVNTEELSSGSVYVDNFSLLTALARDETQVSRFTQYFVDCGDNHPNTLPAGEKFGARNSVTEQVYGMDQITGYNWGVVTTEEDPQIPQPIFSGGTGVWTKYTYPERWNQDDKSDKNGSYRQTWGQEELKPKYIRYAFELDPGTYDITIGFQSFWGDKGERKIIANGVQLGDGVTLSQTSDYDKVVRSVTIPENGNKLSLSIEKEDGNIWVNYIKIETAGEFGELAEIKELYQQVKDVQNDEQDPYYNGSWDAFTKALETAKGYAELDSISRSQQDAVDTAKSALEKAYNGLRKQKDVIDTSLLYFVDCGDHGVYTLTGDDQFGRFNTKTDQIYGLDAETGKYWGVNDPNGNENGGVGLTNDEGVYTSFTSAHERDNVNQVAQDGLNKNTTFRYARGQAENGIDPRYVTYKFQIDSEDGIYPVEIGLGNIWGNSGNPRVYANLGTDMEVLLAEKPDVGNGSHKAIRGEVQAKDGFITVDVRSGDATINVNYIKIGAQENPPVVEKTLTGIEVTAPEKNIYMVGEELDLTGIKVVAHYDDNTTAELSESQYIISGFESGTVGTKTVTITYTENDVEKVTSFEVVVKMPIDKKGLELAIAMAENLQSGSQSFTEETWAKVETALAEGKPLLEKSNVSQEEVDAAFLKLVTACTQLEPGVQKVGLKAAIDGAIAILEDEAATERYTEESVEAVRTALDRAQTVLNTGYDDVEEGQRAVNEATTNLITAVTQMLEKDFSRLGELIRQAELILVGEDKYTSSTVEAVKTCLGVAKDVEADKSSSSEAITAAYNNLAEALTALELRGDKSELKAAVDQAETILAEPEKYLSSTLENLDQVLADAKIVYDNQDAVQEDINRVLEKLIAECLEARLLGDVNQDGTVDAADSAKLLRYTSELDALDQIETQLADVNKDGVSDTLDASLILKLSAEAISGF